MVPVNAVANNRRGLPSRSLNMPHKVALITAMAVLIVPNKPICMPLRPMLL